MSAMNDELIVYVVEDDAAVRRSLERLLGSAGFSSILYENARDFLNAAQGLSAGCVLLDIRMPEMDGLELQSRLNSLGFLLPVIVMTGHGDVQTAVRAMKAGAHDFIEKPFDDERLLSAIDQALALAGRVSREREAAEARDKTTTLSPREREVLEGLVGGKPNKVIAYDLGISVRTVEVHRARMLERLGTRSTAEAIRLAVMSSLTTGNGPSR
jgi:two-component system, LuxR family, response regulator FixJ